ncbi:tyrosine-type recombinase/integrase [Bradyrhizobium sp. LMG 9283]|uniref:tyrosine-type recombinase/integrase n=1 Tax=Bradyrhizobium sp. LMG 9283 TaxID=592064 RepID=UPI00388E06AC
MANVFFPDAERLAARGYESVAHVPVIFDSNGRYCREHNRYLRERARLEWHPGGGADIPRGRTLGNIAERLLNFVLWCEARGIKWRAVTYDDVLRYQKEQIGGEWSRTGIELSPSTANQRADEATNFLRWSVDRRLRGPFEVKMFRRPGRKRLGCGPRMVRVGRAKEDVISLEKAGFVLPKPEQIREWLEAVGRQRGRAKRLACKFIMDTGARRMEVEALTVEQWPKVSDISYARSHGLASVPMRLVTTKGGRPRTIGVPLKYAHEVRIWIDEKRKTHAFRYFKLHRKETNCLFLSDHPAAHGRPISAQTIYRCFSEVRPRPPRWSPHKGRHTFACFWILHALSIEANRGGGLAAMPADWVMNRGEFWLKTLQRQFGHISSETTEEYLRWLVHACGIAEVASGWHEFLESGSDE